MDVLTGRGPTVAVVLIAMAVAGAALLTGCPIAVLPPVPARTRLVGVPDRR